jgi:hypothetical protein
MRRPPQEIVLLLADAIKTMRPGDFITTAELHRKSKIHYKTLQSYFEMLNYVQSKLPQISPEETKQGSGVRILSKPSLKVTESEELILWLFDKGAFREASALPLPDWVSAMNGREATSGGFVEQKDGKAYLTSEGIMKGAELADMRDEMLIHPIGQQFTVAQFEGRKELRDRVLPIVGVWSCRPERRLGREGMPIMICAPEGERLAQKARIGEFEVIRKEEAI